MLVCSTMAVSALQVWLRVQSMPWLVWCALRGAGIGGPHWAAIEAVAMAASYVALVVILGAGRRAADLVTIARFGLLLLVLVAGATAFDATLWAAAVAVVLLDLVDGAVARRFGGSPQGAVLDMEADQFTVLALATLVVAHGGGAHVLILPVLRYVFVLAMWWAGAPAHDPKPVNGDNRRGRRICAAVMVALLVALWPNVAAALRDGVTLVAVLLLAWSFSGDARFLIAHRGTARSRA